jgi:HNH endonuclease
VSIAVFQALFQDASRWRTRLDHVIAVKHGGRTVEGNLALCCTVCNRFKSNDIASIDPEAGQLTPLFHPRRGQWDDHYQFRDGEILALAASGRVTIRLLRMNRSTRIKERLLLR